MKVPKRQSIRHVLPTICLTAAFLLCRPPLPAQVAPAPAQMLEAQGADTKAGAVSGVVTDTDGGIIPGAKVRLTGAGAPQTVTTAIDGTFHLSTLSSAVSPATRIKLVITAPGLATETVSGTLTPGENFDAGTIVLHASADVTIEVLSPHAISEAEVRLEEHQRVLGFAPNFYVAYDFNAPALDARQKWELNWRTLADPVNIALLAGQAGIEQETNSFSGFGTGPAAYGKRFGAAAADFGIGNSLAGWILPVVFKQDPRYFYLGKGTKRHRLLYAVSRSVIARGDNGRWQPAYANVLGSLGAGAISNIYYPAANRQGATLTFENTGLSIGFDAISNLLQEFVLKHVSTGVKQP